jgi:hypothetical protein
MIENLVYLANKNKGLSFNLTTGDLNPKKGFMVSIQGTEMRFFSVTEHTVMMFIGLKWTNFNKSNFLGIWRDEAELKNDGKGHWYFDISVHVENKETALHMAKINNQLAIWDCEKQQAINLDSPELQG